MCQARDTLQSILSADNAALRDDEALKVGSYSAQLTPANRAVNPNLRYVCTADRHFPLILTCQSTLMRSCVCAEEVPNSAVGGYYGAAGEDRGLH